MSGPYRLDSLLVLLLHTSSHAHNKHLFLLSSFPFFYNLTQQPQSDLDRLFRRFLDDTQLVTNKHTSDHPAAEAATQHTKITTDETLCLKRGFEPAVPAIKRLQTHVLDRAAIGIGFFVLHLIQFFVTTPFVSLLLHNHSSPYSSHTAFRLSSRIPRSSIPAAKNFKSDFAAGTLFHSGVNTIKESSAQRRQHACCAVSPVREMRDAAVCYITMKNEQGVNRTGTCGLLQLHSATVRPFSLKCCHGLWRSSGGYTPSLFQVATH